MRFKLRFSEAWTRLHISRHNITWSKVSWSNILAESRCLTSLRLTLLITPQPGNTKEGSITVPLTSCLTGLDQSVLPIKTKFFSCHTADSKPVKQEVNGTVILPPLAFPASTNGKITGSGILTN